MGIVVRQSFKASIVSYVGAFIGYLNIIYISPLCLTPEIIGFNKLFLDAALLLAFLAQLGLNSGITRFFPYFKDGKKNKGFFFFIIVVPLVGFAGLGLILFFGQQYFIGLFSTNSSLFSDNFLFVLPLTFFMMYLGLLETYSTNQLRIVVPKFIREIVLRILNILAIVLFYFKFIDFHIFIISIILMYAIATGLNFWYLSKITSLSIVPQWNNMDKTVIKNFAYYIVFVFFVGIGSNIVSKIDIFMISATINLTSTGIFSVAFFITAIIEIPSRAFLQISNPIIAEAFKKNDINRIKEIYKKSSLNQFIVGGILFILIWINTDNLFEIMPNGEIYRAGKYVILFLGLGKVFDMLTGVNGYIIANSKLYYNHAFFIIYLTMVTILSNYYLIPLYGINGAAISSLFSLGSYNILMLIFLKVKMQIQPFTFVTLKTLMFFIALFVLDYIIPNMNSPYIDAIIRTTSVGSIFILGTYFMKLSPEINEIIDNIRKLNMNNIFPAKMK